MKVTTGEVTTYCIVDAYTYDEDVHRGWRGTAHAEVTAYGHTASPGDITLSFDLPFDGSYVEIAPNGVLGARIVGENSIIFTLVWIGSPGPTTPVDFPSAEIKRGAPKTH